MHVLECLCRDIIDDVVMISSQGVCQTKLPVWYGYERFETPFIAIARTCVALRTGDSRSFVYQSMDVHGGESVVHILYVLPPRTVNQVGRPTGQASHTCGWKLVPLPILYSSSIGSFTSVPS